jgi:hypothetical protein
MNIKKYLDEERGNNGRKKKITYLRYCPYFVKGRQITKYQFYWKSKQSGFVLRNTYASRVRIFPIYLGYS